MKKLLLIIAFTILVLGMNAQNVGDVTKIDYGDYSLNFRITNVELNCCEIVSYGDMNTMAVIIPSTVTIEDAEYSVISIGDCAFDDCYNLTSVTFGDNSQLTSIGDEAFAGCYNLTNIEIPSSVTSIGDYVFAYCYDLEVIKCYAEDVPDASEYWFGGYYVDYDMVIYVPEISLEEYKNTSP